MRYIEPLRNLTFILNGNPIPKWKIAVVCFCSQDKSQIVVKKFGAKPLGYRMSIRCDKDYTYEATLKGQKIGVLAWCTGGGPIAASLVEELSSIGVEYIVGIGAAASIVLDIGKGGMIAVNKVLLSDGTSKSYYPNKDFIDGDQDVINTCLDVCKNLSHEISLVNGVTVDAFYRQTEDIIMPWRKKDAQVLNWEVSAFYASAKKCNVKAIWIGHVSDREMEGKWDDWYDNRVPVHTNCATVCYEVVKKIAEQNKFDKSK